MHDKMLNSEKDNIPDVNYDINNTSDGGLKTNSGADDKSSASDASDNTDFFNFSGSSRTYVKLSDKYEDIRSSAFTMIIVGFLGIIFMVLVYMQIIPIPLNPETSWLFKSVLGGIFIIFIFSGVVSFMHSKKVKIDAMAEDELIDEINSWSAENISSRALDSDLDLSQPEELLYFGRAEKIKNILMHQFENADEALIDELTEQTYQKLYESAGE